MATVIKALTLINEEIEMDIPTDQASFVGVQYGTGGLGTIVLEGKILDPKTEYVAINLTPAAGGASVGSMTAAGLAWADVSFCEKIRVRKSVAGLGPVTVGVTITKRGG